MSGYTCLEDVPFCPSTEDERHDWLDRRMYSSNEPYKAECSACAALIDHLWWGWQFKTGLEHFDDAQHEPAVQALMAELQDNDRRRRRRGFNALRALARGLARVPAQADYIFNNANVMDAHINVENY